jgi:DMSO reductase family type II enzyme chaperone
MATATEDTRPEIEKPSAAAIGTVYGVLAGTFEEPSRETYDAIADGRLFAEVDAILDRSALSLPVPTVRTDDDHELLCARFNDLFAVGYPDPAVPLYETEHVDRAWNDVNLDLARVYDYFDVAVDETEREHHDHLRLELEFAGYLARLEATGEADARRARADFLDRHLDPFLGAVRAAVESEPDTGIYGDIAAFASRFVRADRDHLESRAVVNAE